MDLERIIRIRRNYLEKKGHNSRKMEQFDCQGIIRIRTSNTTIFDSYESSNSEWNTTIQLI